MATEFIEVIVTFATVEDAEAVARDIIERKMGSCSQIAGPMASVYRWKGIVESASEFELRIKTKASLFDRLSQYIREVHPYDVPQIIAFPIDYISESYAAWIENSVL